MPGQVARLPLFPLNTVLFPGQTLPLHIFEPRYRLMVDRCLEQDEPFGVVLARKEGELPHRVGTTARIVEVERLEDGRMNIVTLGEARFRVLRLHDEQPYLAGDLVAWPWTTGNPAGLDQPVRELRQQLAAYVDAMAHFWGSWIQIEDVPAYPVTLGCLAAIALQVSLQEKQALLLSPTLDALLDKEIALLQREMHLVPITRGVPTRLPDEDERMLSDN